MIWGKEVTIAAVLGLILGIIAAVGIWKIPQINKSVKQEITLNVTTASPIPVIDSKITLEVNQPEDGLIAEKKEITVSGKTLAGSMVVINGPQIDLIIQADTNGNFSTPITIEEGENILDITAYRNDFTDDFITITRIVNYTEEEF